MWTNPQFPADLVTITVEIFNGKLHFYAVTTKTYVLMNKLTNNERMIWRIDRKTLVIVLIVAVSDGAVLRYVILNRIKSYIVEKNLS